MADDRNAGRSRRPLVVAALLGALAFWLPIPFGSVVVWSHAVFHVGAFLILAIAAIVLPERPLTPRAFVPALVVALLAGLALAQAASWPVDIVRTLSPEHARLQRQAAAALAAAGAAVDVPSTLSLAPEATRHAALTWAAVAACAAVAALVGSRSRERRVLLAALVAAALFEVAVGTIGLASHSRQIWGTTVGGDPTRLRGTFVNSDHLAYLIEIALAAAFAWVWWAVRRARWESAPERRILIAAPPALVWVTLFVGLAFTGSRAGLIAGLTAALAQGLAVASQARRWRLSASGLLAAAVGVGAVAAVSVQQGLGRWLATSQYDLAWNDRIEVYDLALGLWQRYPLLGSGVATFRDSFPAVQTPELTGAYWHAHNDYAELLVTTGIVGALVVLVGLVAVVRGIGRALQSGRRSEDRAAALAALGTVAAVAVHSCLDFGLSMPANAAWLGIVLGAALAVPLQQSEASRGDQSL